MDRLLCWQRERDTHDVKPEILRAFITRNGGEAVRLEKT